jgi:triosephosphate isomerase (TIM)
MARTKLICGNWKMHHGADETRKQACALVEGARGLTGVELAIGPVATVLFVACEATRGSNVGVAAQNVHWTGPRRARSRASGRRSTSSSSA